MRVTWGDETLEEALNEWEPGSGEFEQYTGDRPPRGVYQFKLSRLELTKSLNGFKQLIAHWNLKPHRPEHAEYDGYYMRDYIVVKEDGSTAFRVAPFQRALGVTAKQFRTLTDANKTDRETNHGHPIYEVVKIGPVKFPGNLVMAAIKPDKRNPEYEAITYLPKDTKADTTTSKAAAPADDNGSDDSGSGKQEDDPF